jgi:hypothetical protein
VHRTEAKGEKLKPRYVFLFSSAIIVCKPKVALFVCCVIALTAAGRLLPF